MGRWLLIVSVGMWGCQDEPDPAGCRSDGALGSCCDEAAPCAAPLVCRLVGDRQACTAACDPAATDSGCPDGSVCAATGGEASCVPAGGVVGEACGYTDDCRPGLQCETRFPGGYCTAECGKGTPCPAGVGEARCVRLSGDYGAYCLQPCESDADCSGAVACTPVGSSGLSVCFPTF